MSKTKNLGEFEIIVLAAIIRLGQNAYGVSIQDEIANRSGRMTTVGALYSTLSRLEKKDMLVTRMGETTAERGGRAKRYYNITPAGHAQFQASIHVLGAMLKGLPTWPSPT